MSVECTAGADYIISSTELPKSQLSMEAGTLLRTTPLEFNPRQRYRYPHPSKLHCHFSLCPRSVTVTASVNSQKDYQGPKPRKEWVVDWVSKNDDAVRSLPIYVGGLSLLAVLFNRTVSGIAPVADASSSQSRADLLTLGLAVTNILNGLVWLSIRPKSISAVNPDGVECQRICSVLPDFVVSELLWVWESLSDVTCCKSLVILYEKRCIMQAGFAAASSSDSDVAIGVDADKLMKGSLYQGIIRSKSQSYLANLSLYPAKSELPFLPSNTQAVILQPLGDSGLAIIGGDTIRGFTTSDQAWITLVGEKLDSTLAKMSNIPVQQQVKVPASTIGA